MAGRSVADKKQRERKHKHHPNVHRVDHHAFHGWAVSLKRHGVRHQRYFNDGPDPKAGLRRALEWRDKIASTLPPLRKFKRTYTRSTTGVIGVALDVQYSRKGTRLEYYVANWNDADGRKRKRSFSITKYGKGTARALAIEARTAALREQLVTPLRPR